MQLLIDVGNTRIKWAYSQDGKLGQHGSASHEGLIPVEAVNAWRDFPNRVIAANVAGYGYAEQLTTWVQQHWQLQVEFATLELSRFELAYAEPERFGIDRWLALVAARTLVDRTVAVIDAGTALTLDIVLAEGKHVGGIILPGLSLMSESLKQKSSGVRHGCGKVTAGESGLLGKDTRGCIEKGALYAVTGAVEHVLKRFQAEVGEVQSVIICGGDGKQISAELDIHSKLVPDLVLQGLQIVKGGS